MTKFYGRITVLFFVTVFKIMKTLLFKSDLVAVVLAGLAMVVSGSAHASCEIDIADYVGWKIIYSGTVTGYIDDDGKEEDNFEGCEYGRVIIVDYHKQVICEEYGYSYAYHPDIVVMSNGHSRKACIDDDIYDVR